MDESVQKHLSPKLDDASRLLLRAADLIETNGLAKGKLCENDAGILGAMCVRGALNYATTRYAFGWDGAFDKGTPRHEAENRLANVLGLIPHLYTEAPGCLPLWNNAPERTASEVVSAIRRAAFGG